jgi:hypothetical protein
MTLRAPALIEGNQLFADPPPGNRAAFANCKRVGHVMQNAQAFNDLKARGKKTAIQMWDVVGGLPA